MAKIVLPLFCAGALLALGVLSARADTVTLNSGEQIEGKIITETDSKVIMEVKVSASITDQRTVERKDIKTVVKATPDEVAYQSLKSMKVGPNSLGVTEYDKCIGAFTAFVTRFPAGSRVKDAQSDIDALKQEQKRVAVGELKWKGRWYTAQEAAQQKYQIDAERLRGVMREMADRGDTIGALNTFDKLERGYPVSSSYPEAAENAMLLIQRLRAEIDRAVGLAKIQKTQFDSGIVLETEPTKSAMIAAQKRQIAGAEATLAIAEKSGIKWKPLLPVIDKSPAALRATATAELQRLAKLPLANMRKSVELAAAGFEAVSAKNLSDAAVKCQEAEGLWSANEMLVRLKPMLAASKVAETKAETAKVEAAKGKAEATPTPILNRVKSWFSF